jgi:hypothetical protein
VIYAEGGDSFTPKDFPRVCVCGNTFGSHGGDKPHGYHQGGVGCDAFRDRDEKPVDPAVIKARAKELSQFITEVENL